MDNFEILKQSLIESGRIKAEPSLLELVGFLDECVKDNLLNSQAKADDMNRYIELIKGRLNDE